MTDTPPDRLSTNPRSEWFDAAPLGRGVGIRFNGVEKTNVDEYCVSEGWVKLAAGRSRDRFGNPMTVMLKGSVEPYFRDIAGDGADAPGEEDDLSYHELVTGFLTELCSRWACTVWRTGCSKRSCGCSRVSSITSRAS